MAHEPVKITVLADYEASDGLDTEHGFSAWVEIGSRRILFDTGQTGVAQANAARLGIDFGSAGSLVLSHGHFDHTGTLPQFLDANATARVYFARGVPVERYSCKPGTPVRSIGMPDASRQALSALPSARLFELGKARYLAPGIGITGPVPRQTAFEDVGGPFFLDADSIAPDMIDDDQSMWFETERGLVILLGCCHAGVVNTVEYIRMISGIRKVRGIVGGMHLVNADRKRLDCTFGEMADWSPEFLVPCHCTGADAVERMEHVLGGAVSKGYAGRAIYAGNLRF